MFYTLTPYADQSGQQAAAKMALVPFVDRPLTEFEHDERLAWWTEIEVTPVGNEGNPFMKRIEQALDKEKEDRTEAEHYIVAVLQALQQRVEQMDTRHNEGE